MNATGVRPPEGKPRKEKGPVFVQSITITECPQLSPFSVLMLGHLDNTGLGPKLGDGQKSNNHTMYEYKPGYGSARKPKEP